MKGWFVDKDTGRPIAKTHKKHKPDLVAAGHPFITDPIPPGLHDRSIGRFAKWTLSGWERDAAREQAYEDKQDEKDQRKSEAINAFKENSQILMNSPDWASGQTHIKLHMNLLKVLRYLGTQLDT